MSFDKTRAILQKHWHFCTVADFENLWVFFFNHLISAILSLEFGAYTVHSTSVPRCTVNWQCLSLKQWPLQIGEGEMEVSWRWSKRTRPQEQGGKSCRKIKWLLSVVLIFIQCTVTGSQKLCLTILFKVSHNLLLVSRHFTQCMFNIRDSLLSQRLSQFWLSLFCWPHSVY